MAVGTTIGIIITAIIVCILVGCFVFRTGKVSEVEDPKSETAPELEEIPEDISADAKAVLKLMGRFMRFSSNPAGLGDILNLQEANGLGIRLPDKTDSGKLTAWALRLEKEDDGDAGILAKELAECFEGVRGKPLILFCMKMLLSEEKVKKGPLALLEDIAKGLGVDQEWYRQKLHKYVSVEKLENDAEIQPLYLGLGGISDDGEKKDYLTRLYMKWTPVSTNCDPVKAARAQKLLGLIKTCRAKLENSIK